MQLLRIEIENFRNIEHAQLDGLSPTLALFGWNRQCKSSILLALQMLLFGWCPLTDRRGGKADALVHDGAKEAVISADVFVRGGDPEALRITLRLKRRGQNEWTAIDPDTGEVPFESRSEFWAHAGINERHAMVAAMPAQFLASKELGGILQELLVGDVEPEVVRKTILDHARQHLADQIKGAKEMAAALATEYVEWASTFAQQRGLDVDAPGGLESLGKAAFDHRRDIKRELKEEQTRLEDMGFVSDATDSQRKVRSVDELPAIRKGVEGLVEHEKALLEEKGRAEQAVSAKDVAVQRHAVEDALAVARAAEVTADEEVRAATAAEAMASDAVDAAKTEETSASLARAEAQRQSDQAKRALGLLNTPDGRCPTCGKGYTDKDRATFLGPLEREAERAEAMLARAVSAVEAHLAAVTERRQELAAAKPAKQRAERKQREASGVVADASAKLRALPVPYAGRPLAEVTADLAETQRQIALGKTLHAALERVDAKQSSEAFIETLERDIARLNWAVKAFRDGEVTKQFMRDGLADFTHRANLELEPFGFSLGVSVVGKAVDIMLQCPEAQAARAYYLCSGAEQLLTQHAVALAFADTGAPVILDELNGLDPRYRKGVLARLRDTPRMASVIVAAAWQGTVESVEPVAQALAPVTVVWAKGGGVEISRVAEEVAA